MLLEFMSRLSFSAKFPTSNNMSMSSFDLRKKKPNNISKVYKNILFIIITKYITCKIKYCKL